MRGEQITAVVVAGGSSLRFGGEIPKQFLPLGGKPVLARTLAAFERAEAVTDIIAVVPEAYMDSAWETVIHPYALRKVTRVVTGGADRQSSVYNALRAVKPDTDIILLHDGARPFVTGRLIADVIQGTRVDGAACAGIKSTDTLKLADADGFVQSTLNRERIWAAQTPQGFAYTLILRAHEQARASGIPAATDDAALVERLGIPVRMVPGDVRNIKITTRVDMAIAESLLDEDYI